MNNNNTIKGKIQSLIQSELKKIPSSYETTIVDIDEMYEPLSYSALTVGDPTCGLPKITEEVAEENTSSDNPGKQKIDKNHKDESCSPSGYYNGKRIKYVVQFVDEHGHSVAKRVDYEEPINNKETAKAVGKSFSNAYGHKNKLTLGQLRGGSISRTADPRKDYINSSYSNSTSDVSLTSYDATCGEPQAYDSIISKYCAEYEVDPALVKAMMKQESGFSAGATSWCGATGLMQVMPETAIGVEPGITVEELYVPDNSIRIGVKYLKEQLNTFNGNIRFAVAAYNAGPGAVQDYNGVPPYSETQNYVKNVMYYYQQYKGNQ